ncbi:hypothetical protein SAMN04488524_2132 [Pedobacter africanus]|uniref:Uncharacterized protein n=1 Tax=Pedobacter africanus TaxID=151894 RepID=A0A1W2B953_9SPHI|nr:hypothetical protein SAMN04488524_2132 [Pedobacter africanus]
MLNALHFCRISYFFILRKIIYLIGVVKSSQYNLAKCGIQ